MSNSVLLCNNFPYKTVQKFKLTTHVYCFVYKKKKIISLALLDGDSCSSVFLFHWFRVVKFTAQNRQVSWSKWKGGIRSSGSSLCVHGEKKKKKGTATIRPEVETASVMLHCLSAEKTCGKQRRKEKKTNSTAQKKSICLIFLEIVQEVFMPSTHHKPKPKDSLKAISTGTSGTESWKQT